MDIHVIIPVYNAEKYLQQAVDSVLNQPYKNIDIVLINDGSTDSSAQICDNISAQEQRVEVIHQQNSGVSAARNKGIEYFLNKCPEDDYIAFLDADDMWVAEAVDEELISKLKSETEADVVAFSGVRCCEKAINFSLPELYKEKIVWENDIVWKVKGHFCACLYKVGLLKNFNIKFNEKAKYSEDKFFQMQCVFLAERVKFAVKILHICRNNATSAMKQIFSYNPIDYYTPIVNGWIESDLFLNSYSERTGKTIEAGFNLASVYFMEMAMDHHKRWKPAKELETVKTHPYYYLFENMKENCVSAKNYREHKLMLNHPGMFKLKYNAIGAVEYLARGILGIKPIYNLRERKRYPLTSVSNKR